MGEKEYVCMHCGWMKGREQMSEWMRVTSWKSRISSKFIGDVSCARRDLKSWSYRRARIKTGDVAIETFDEVIGFCVLSFSPLSSSFVVSLLGPLSFLFSLDLWRVRGDEEAVDSDSDPDLDLEAEPEDFDSPREVNPISGAVANFWLTVSKSAFSLYVCCWIHRSYIDGSCLLFVCCQLIPSTKRKSITTLHIKDRISKNKT